MEVEMNVAAVPRLASAGPAPGSASSSATYELMSLGTPTPASAAPSDAKSAPPEKRAYPLPAQVPTQPGPKGIQFDFNYGCRVILPENEHSWRVRLSDL